MSSNNLYDQLIQMARNENIEFSETQSSRASELPLDNYFAQKMKEIRYEIEIVRNNNEKILRLKNKMSLNALPTQESCMNCSNT